MNKILAIMILLSTSIVYADSIKCYSDGKMIYHHNVRDISYVDNLFIFDEISSNKIVMINGKCIIKISN